LGAAVAGRIRITSGDQAGQAIEVHDEVLLGRRQDEPGKIRDLEVSRMHARVYVDAGGGLTIEDANSTNGTFVGGERITGPRPLGPGDTIRLGQTTLEVEAVGAVAEAAAAAGPAVVAEPEDAEAEAEVVDAEPEPPAAEPEPAGAEPPPDAELVHAEPEPPAAEPEPVDAEPPADAEPEPAAAETPPAEPEPATRGSGVPRPLVFVLLGVLLLAAAGIAAVLLFTGGEDEEDGPPPRVQGPPALVSAATEAGCIARDLEPEGERMVTGQVRYRSNPPHSGDYWEKPASDGIWETAPPMPKIVRSLHMGRIVMWHKPGDDKAYGILREVGDERPKHMLLVPNRSMPHRLAVTAWGHLLGCSTINGSTAAAVRAFRDAYRDKGPVYEP
jgi:hypothetical protein